MAWREPEDGEFSEKLDAHFDKPNSCWICARCLAVLGSVGCCRASWKEEEAKHKAAKEARRKASGKPRREWTAPDLGGPFEVRGVDAERRRFFRLVEQPIRFYFDACLTADAFRASFPLLHVVVWCRTLQRPLYDSRTMAGKWPSTEGIEEAE